MKDLILNDPFRVFFVVMAIIAILIIVGGEIVSWFKKANVMPDEFENADDCYALLYKEPRSNSILSGRFSPEKYTCFYCDAVSKCPYAFDDYCMDGDCLNK